jgi:hypothetical protein
MLVLFSLRARRDSGRLGRSMILEQIHQDTKRDGSQFWEPSLGRGKTRRPLEEERKRRDSFDLHRLQLFGVEAQRLKDGGRDLLVENIRFHVPGREFRVGEEQRHMNIVLVEAAVLGDL